jgi:hypothetical protein
MMITTKTAHPASKMYYVGVPTEAFEEGFDEFEYVPDEQLPKEIDAVIVAAVESQEFTSRFRYLSETLAAETVHFLDGQ